MAIYFDVVKLKLGLSTSLWQNKKLNLSIVKENIEVPFGWLNQDLIVG